MPHRALIKELSTCILELRSLYGSKQVDASDLTLAVHSKFAHTLCEFCCGADDVRVTHPPQDLGIAGCYSSWKGPGERILLSLAYQTVTGRCFAAEDEMTEELYSIGALTIGIGFCGPIYYSYIKEPPQKSIGNY